MGNRGLPPKARDIVVAMIADRDGFKCSNSECQAPATYVPRLDKIMCKDLPIELEHRNGNKRDYAPSNLYLLCKGCNVGRRNSLSASDARETKERRAMGRENGHVTHGHDVTHLPPSHDHAKGIGGVPGAVCMCVQTSNLDERALLKHAFDYEHGTSAQQMNMYAEIKVREFLADYTSKHGKISRQEALRSGAAVSGASTSTVARYIEPLLAEVGGLYDDIHESYHKTWIVPRQSGESVIEPPLVSFRHYNGNGRNASESDDVRQPGAGAETPS